VGTSGERQDDCEEKVGVTAGIVTSNLDPSERTAESNAVTPDEMKALQEFLTNTEAGNDLPATVTGSR